MKNIKNLLFLAFTMLALALPSFAQSRPTITTTAAAVGVNDLTVQVTSATGITSQLSNQATSPPTFYLLIDSELMLVRSISGTSATVVRNQAGTIKTAHINGAEIIVGPGGTWAPNSTGSGSSGIFLGTGVTPAGNCLRANQNYLPLINVGQQKFYNCLGGVWVPQTMLDGIAAGQLAQQVCTLKSVGSGALASLGASLLPGTAGNFYYSTFYNPTTRVVTNMRPLWGTVVGSATGFVSGIYEWNTVTSGALLFNTTTAGTASGTLTTFQNHALTSVGILTGPATYMAFIQAAGTTDGIMALVTVGGENLSTLRAGTFGTLPGSVAAATGTVASTAPMICVN